MTQAVLSYLKFPAHVEEEFCGRISTLLVSQFSKEEGHKAITLHRSTGMNEHPYGGTIKWVFCIILL
jgi:hypothetical protein